MSLEKEAYEQNYQQFRSLNQIMWQIPVLAMTLTGGLWFGVSKIEDNPLLASTLLCTAVVGNLALSAVLYRFRFVMRRYLSWLKNASPDGFVDASSPDEEMGPVAVFFAAEERVRQMFSIMLYWAVGASLALLSVELYQWKTESKRMDPDAGIEFYDSHAAALADSYEAISFEDAYPFLVTTLSADSVSILDIGSGTGRDASWLARHGHKVVAAEPSASMRKIAEAIHPDDAIEWIDARLPELENTRLKPNSFDIVLASAVWMHIPPEQRKASLLRIGELLSDGGRAFVSLRIGPQDEDRGMHEVNASEFEDTAEQAGFELFSHGDFDDLLGRAQISWKMYELHTR
ncbi:class I SAM-dependent methyltransferase [Phaeobacter sp. CNT1-3]|nr:class I SAM-dependent methyltransferase [Phaeobacter sp. CNT1-3]